ncbi:C-Myc-binding family protein [Toxoplasma gondii RUB]|uniref:c-Myc binding protein, putative n=13 Tax=Toxoplasma gondii TaxID=5811 RepID=A0A125YN03_TOXGV|nr:C-Myc-binding family protein [Toxoplasma gondii GT1]ESS29043.1 C-Myc-binding family protein [Toxoplasma gondii VEG]KAF4644703.1 C-Myc-binding family protein [Toxoplasma gondii]KFG28447.1 C-Myc-binding family protein [Toxoplasma gondii p89]KFG33262.1 C-Myc-binding family protein [Toxoplasma gondii GAB2-2007-GAL-DOM2]KFG45366.1 C-Myc-binding family protein [Toxoplasma gondii FOU]KFG59242.1 C-Myc-binding family protein [Toxoplasma gondii RUB]KFH02576.1 C-Myc-binding family protein [Toxoplasm
MADPVELQKQEFKKYLEDHGVLQQLSRVLVGLYEEPDRPLNALDYIKKYLGAPTGADIDALRSEVDSLKKENAGLKARVEQLQQEVDTLRQDLEA